MNYLPTTLEEADLKPEKKFIWYDDCPLCGGPFRWFKSEVSFGRESFLRICFAKPAKIDKTSCHLVMSHYFEDYVKYKEDRIIGGQNFSQRFSIHTPQTHPNICPLIIHYKADNSFKNNYKFINKRTEIKILNQQEYLKLPLWWNPGKLSDDYRDIYKRAKRLLNLT